MRNLWLALALASCAHAATTRRPAPLTVIHVGEIDDDLAAAVSDALDDLEKAGTTEVVVAIDSPGGDMDAGMTMARDFERRAIRVTCVVDGEADSMALALLASCDRRLMTKRSVLMAHRPSLGRKRIDDVDAANLVEYLRVLDEAVLQQYSLHSPTPIEEWRRRTLDGRQWWFDWRDALKHGLVDGTCRSAGEVAWRR